MEKQPLIDEASSYRVLLYRKNRAMRLLETVLFLFGLGIILWNVELRSTAFTIAIIGWTVAVLFLSPAIYKMVVHPHYTLYADRLVIKQGKNVEDIQLSEIEKDFDLPYVYLIKEKRVPILVSSTFLDELNMRLEVIKRGWKS